MLVKNGNIVIEVLQTGDIRKISHGDIMINQIVTNHLDYMPANLFLRIKTAMGYEAYPMIGKASGGSFGVSEKQVVYTGRAGEVAYKVYITPVDNEWFYDVFLSNEGGEKEIDVIYGQDIGLAGQGHVQGNEAYNCQYIDHKAFQTEQGYVLCSRQNQAQSTGFPFLQQGSLHKTVSFSTDGYQFYGLDYKITNQIAGLQKDSLDNRVYQYEFAYSALQTDTMILDKEAHLVIYGILLPNHPDPVESPAAIDGLLKAHAGLRFEEPAQWQCFVPAIDVNRTLPSKPLMMQEITDLYPVRRHEEKEGADILSFFKENGEHVVLMEKEKYVERSHGHIIISGENDFIREDILASTNYMYGVFSSQVVVGNTSFNKLNSNCRNGLNVSKANGQRIMLKTDGRYHLLTMPAAYEMGFNYARWLYKFNGDMIEIISHTSLDRADLRLSFRSLLNRSYDILLYNQICNAPGEYDVPVSFERSGNTVTTRHKQGTLSAGAYPDMCFVMHSDRDFDLYNDEPFYPALGSMQEPYMLMEFQNASSFTIRTEARIDGKPIADSGRTFAEEAEAYRAWLKTGINDFQLHIDGDDQELAREIDKFNDLSLWYSHNARIHYASPHGLEQYGGAAWGTRDACQGPFEYFLATQNFQAAKEVLATVYRHQYEDDGSWPQWFMFDRYAKIQHAESHGDIIVWPLKALAGYLLATGDTAFLQQTLAYTRKGSFDFTTEQESLLCHVQKEIRYIQDHFIQGTFLSCYGDGDWDDTLQPADPALRKSMVSGWTVTLTYQALKEFAMALESVDDGYAGELNRLAENIRADYRRYIIKDGVTAGFILFEEGERMRYLLHPRDQETGITYRLLPMTRSMIGEMFDKEEMERHLAIIKEKLYHPDGVRLMDTTCRYRGGVNTYFMRAETAANFGREIGLQYVHAHIRFIEAMAKTGKAHEAWHGLWQINPIGISSVVKNAEKRQSNCYFSSSDGAFSNRYEAMADFDKLRTGDIGVKAGWRIYSSGSGIYLNQLISQCLGLRLRLSREQVILDPVMPVRLDGLAFSYKIKGRPVTIRYHIAKGCGVTRLQIDGRDIAFESLSNPYREPDAAFDLSLIKHEGSSIDVYL